MAELKVENTTYTNLTGTVNKFTVDSSNIEETGAGGVYYISKDWQTWYNYYTSIPEFKSVVDAFATWVCGLGASVEQPYADIVDHITGDGKESFYEIMWNQVVTMLVNGDSFAEIIWEDMEKHKGLLNIKSLNPARVRIHYNESGLIDFYEEYDEAAKKVEKKINPRNMFHLRNQKVANSIGGCSVAKACKWIMDSRNEAMSDTRRIMHRSTIRIIEVDVDDTSRLNTLKNQYQEAINAGEVLIVPKDIVTFPIVEPLSTEQHRAWIKELENAFYLAVGMPKIIVGGSQDYTEAASKMGILTFEVPHKAGRFKLETALWNQLQLKIDFDEPASIKDDVATSEAANTGQTNFQPMDFAPSVQRNN